MLNQCKSRQAVLGILVLVLAAAIPAVAQQADASTPAAQSGNDGVLNVPTGSTMNVACHITAKENRTLKVTTVAGSRLVVVLTNQTQIKEKKSNPFRSARRYTEEQLVRGLNIEVKGRGDGSGSLVADEIRFTKDDLWVAQTVHNRVHPVEARLEDAETRLGRSEQNAQHLAGQVDELMAVSNAARGGAKAAQETADAAQLAAKAAQESANEASAGVRAANERIVSLDEFEVRQSTVVNFDAGSSALSGDAKALLDRLASEAKAARGYVIEVTGYASSDGNEAFNRRLSEQRANAVVRYLVEQNQVPLRRVTTPFGYGEKLPVADNSTRKGRTQNRRVEIRILVNRGISDKAAVTTAEQRSGN